MNYFSLGWRLCALAYWLNYGLVDGLEVGNMVKHYVVTEGEIKKFKWGFEAWPYWEKHGGTHCYITQETGGDYELNAYRNGKPEVIGNYTTLQAAEDYLPKIK